MVMMVAVSGAAFAPFAAGILLLYPQSRPKGSREVPENRAESSAKARQYGGGDDACFLASCFLNDGKTIFMHRVMDGADLSLEGSPNFLLTGYKLFFRTFIYGCFQK